MWTSLSVVISYLGHESVQCRFSGQTVCLDRNLTMVREWLMNNNIDTLSGWTVWEVTRQYDIFNIHELNLHIPVSRIRNFVARTA